jgi:membrane protein YdbS with pleckstrin-like domain
VPDIFLVLGIGFLIKCVVEEYKAMGMKKESDKSSKLLRLWIIAQVADMIVIDMMLDINNVLGHHTSNTTYIIVVATAILYTVTLVWICICIRKFSYDVYMDYYNKRSR